MRTVFVILAISVFFVVGVWWGYPKLRNDIDTYDEKFSSCMEVKKSWLPRVYRLDFQSPEYQAMMKDCEREANST